MLNLITLKNFRQFSDKTVCFEPGNTSIRGANEAGKSTIVEGFLYVIGGATRTRGDFITWGAKPASCSVEALLTLQGVQIRATRSPKGAEIYVPDNAAKPTITGQKECTAWFAEQFGAPLDVVMKMAFAKQKEIGGLLDEGNTQAVEFIEQMSGLDIVEYLIEQIQAPGEYGVTSSLVERIDADRETLKAERLISYDGAIALVENKLAPLEAALKQQKVLVSKTEDAVKVDRELLRSISKHLSAVSAAEQHVNRSLATHREVLIDHQQAVAALSTLPDEAAAQVKLAAARQGQKDFEQQDIIISAYARFKKYERPDPEWDEGLPALKAFIAAARAAERHARATVVDLKTEMRDADRDIKSLEGKKITSSACGLCGKDISELESVKTTNAALDTEIAALRASRVTAEAQIPPIEAKAQEEAENAAAGQSILDAPRFEFALGHPALFAIDEQFVPFRVEWIGPELDGAQPKLVSCVQEVTAAEGDLRKLALTKQAVQTALARVTAERDKLEMARGSLVDLKQLVPQDSEDAVSARIDTAELTLAAARLKVNELNSEIGGHSGQLKSLREHAARHDQLVNQLADSLVKNETLLARYDFNNQLIEDLRRARPIVANELWNIVLMSVSTYLTRMRGEPSIVEREGKTFSVNGRPSSSYSGSALDLLALGIRIALTKVFVPSADMLVLDEPFAACDEARTLQCLGFAASAGFAQTLVITHENAAESVFDHVLEV